MTHCSRATINLEIQHLCRVPLHALSSILVELALLIHQTSIRLLFFLNIGERSTASLLLLSSLTGNATLRRDKVYEESFGILQIKDVTSISFAQSSKLSSRSVPKIYVES